MLDILTIALCQSYATIPVILPPYLTLLPWKNKNVCCTSLVRTEWFDKLHIN